MAIASREGRAKLSAPRFKSAMSLMWWIVAKMLTTTPTKDQAYAYPEGKFRRPNMQLRHRRREFAQNNPKRATAKPKPISARPVRIHAGKVRSAAK
ncbi:MAG TPA: hypothetical protein VMT64_13190 [Candidatus Binataceae bacterium]|nr:hypothetical protein [Candidatus Binataceae bacterium]